MRNSDASTEVILPSISILGEQALDKFNKSIISGSNIRAILLCNKLILCDFKILFITGDLSIFERYNLCRDDIQKLTDLSSAWKIVLSSGVEEIEKHKQAWSIIDQIGERSPGHLRPASPRLRRFRNSAGSNIYIVLIAGDEPEILPLFELNNLCNNWQLEHGLIPIHSAGVVHRGKLLLFAGPSGAGKSTVSNLSADQGDRVLDEDQLLLNPYEDRSWQAQAWGYSLQTSAAPLTAVFKLVQDTEDRLIPLSSLQTAHFLMDRVLDVMGLALEKKSLEQIFHRIAGLSRHIPGYELHFRKSADFWGLIDDELHD
jgi:hypothetical protein